MPQLAINSLEVQVTRGMSYTVDRVGDVARAFSGKVRSDIRGYNRVLQVATPPLSLDDAEALRWVLLADQPLSVSGDIVGSTANFFARNVRVQPVTATERSLSFELHETLTS